MRRNRWAASTRLRCNERARAQPPAAHAAPLPPPPPRTTRPAAAGWLAVLDVDEFIFPCARESRDYTIWDAFSAALPPGGNAISLKCLKFGFSDFDRPLARGQLIMEHNTHRAPYPDLEPHLEAAARASLPGCEKSHPNNSLGVCSNMRARKTIYRLDIAAAAEPGWHFPSALDYDCDRLSPAWSRVTGVCCNHYMLRTTHAEMLTKFMKTWRDSNVLLKRGEGDARKWYTWVRDTQIFQYLIDMKEARARRGLPVTGVLPSAAAGMVVKDKDPEEWRCGRCRAGSEVGC